MKLLSNLVFSSIKVRVLVSFMALGLYAVSIHLSAEETASSAEAASQQYEQNWWRSVRKGMWLWEGGDWGVIESALNNIKSAKGTRRYEDKFDTIIDFGPGHWVYEWNVIADKAYREGLEHEKNSNKDAARKAFLQASVYYTQSSYPHLRDKHSRSAITKAFEMYSRAGRYLTVPLQEWQLEVDGVSFKAFIHLPKSYLSKDHSGLQTNEPLPVILKTGGMDVMSTEFYPLSQMINEAGAAMIIYDSPGTGNLGIVDENYDKHHRAVLTKVLADKRFDDKRIGLWSESLAGVTAVKAAIGNYKEHIAAAVNDCGPIDALYALKLTGGVPKEYNVSKILIAYRAGDLSKEQISKFNEDMMNPQLQGLLLNFQGETFVDRVRADPNSVLDILSKSVDISLIRQGLLPRKNITNTPLLTINTHDDPLVPSIESQMATDASVQGKQMIYNNYGGHCVDRDEMPTVIEWLAYHLKLDVLGQIVETNRSQ